MDFIRSLHLKLLLGGEVTGGKGLAWPVKEDGSPEWRLIRTVDGDKDYTADWSKSWKVRVRGAKRRVEVVVEERSEERSDELKW